MQRMLPQLLAEKDRVRRRNLDNAPYRNATSISDIAHMVKLKKQQMQEHERACGLQGTLPLRLDALQNLRRASEVYGEPKQSTGKDAIARAKPLCRNSRLNAKA
eukprot:scaffold2186_cov245-Pinguiococcus_pyrenoidosus.AAC.2